LKPNSNRRSGVQGGQFSVSTTPVYWSILG
jgi:hypothetical protein